MEYYACCTRNYIFNHFIKLQMYLLIQVAWNDIYVLVKAETLFHFVQTEQKHMLSLANILGKKRQNLWNYLKIIFIMQQIEPFFSSR